VFNAIAVVSAVLCVATVALWVRSYWYDTSIDFDVADPPRTIWIYSSSARLHFESLTYLAYVRVTKCRISFNDNRRIVSDWSWTRLRIPEGWCILGFECYQPIRDITRCTDVAIPYWFLTSAASMLPAIWIRKRSRMAKVNARYIKGRCVACGYDLRATPERCPECGAVPQNAGARI
jgi:hypothetical protein